MGKDDNKSIQKMNPSHPVYTEMRRCILTLTTFTTFIYCNQVRGSESPISERHSALAVKSKGRTPASNLKIKSSGVPTYEMYKKVQSGKLGASTKKVDSIPRLDIGQERQVEGGNFSAKLSTPELKLSDKINVKVHAQLNLIKLDPIKTRAATVSSPQKVTLTTALQKVPPLPELPVVQSPQIIEPHPEVRNLATLQPNDYKLLQAMIFLERHRNLELGLALLTDTMEDPKVRFASQYFYAQTALELGLPSDYRIYILKTATDNQGGFWQKRALQSVLQIPGPIEISDIKTLDPFFKKSELDYAGHDEFLIKRAKYFLSVGNLGEVEATLNEIGSESKLRPDADMISGLLNYRQGKLDEGILDLQRVMNAIEGQRTHPLHTIGALTLARMYFQKSMYKEAFNSFLLVDKQDSLWQQAMVEQAWTQVLSEDYEGAAGNMFSLHTDFFRNSFAPESYVVRSVSYLNLCQFGDGASILNDMKRKYSPWQSAMAKFKNENKSSIPYYETVKLWMKNPSLKEVEGLPRSFIVELARHPNFIKLQEKINSYEDEISKLNQISLKVIDHEKQALKEQNALLAKIGNKIKDAKVNKSVNDEIVQLEKDLLAVRVQFYIAQKARSAIKKIRSNGQQRFELEKNRIKTQASEILAKRFDKILSYVGHAMEQIDLLQYEIYSGAGEHLRYQAAGGDVNTKGRAELKVEDGKSLNWKFQGEIWEDEVGHYRSSLKNVCAQEEKISSVGE